MTDGEVECVYVREREREREGRTAYTPLEDLLSLFHSLQNRYSS